MIEPRSLLLLAGLGLAAFAGGFASPASADPGEATRAVNLRQCASARCDRILTIPAGAAVEVIGQQGSWYEVVYRGRSGFASSRYIALFRYEEPRPVYVPPVYVPPRYEPYEYDPFFDDPFYDPFPREHRRRHRPHRDRDDDRPGRPPPPQDGNTDVPPIEPPPPPQGGSDDVPPSDQPPPDSGGPVLPDDGGAGAGAGGGGNCDPDVPVC